MVSVLHKEVEYEAKKLKYKRVGGHAAEDQNKYPKFQLVNKRTILDQSTTCYTVVIDLYSLSFICEE